MKQFDFIYEGPPPPPCSTSPVAEIFSWAVWRAMELGLNDVIVDETERGLVVGCLDYTKKGKHHGPRYVALVTLPHLRGSPLRGMPAEALGIAATGEDRWNVRLWTCQKLTGETYRLCAILQLVPYAAA